MKKTLITLATASTLILTISGCSSNTPANNSNPSASPSSGTSPNPSPGTPTGGNVVTKEAVIAVYTCVKAKEPSLAGVMDAYIAGVNATTDANWVARDAKDQETRAKGYEKLGCKL